MTQQRTLEEAGALAPLVSAEDAAARVAEGAILVDVRGTAGWSGGVIDGSITADRNAIEEEFAPDSDTRHPGIDTESTIVVVCGSVRGSGPVAAQLIDMGFSNVTHVEGGFPALAEASGVAAEGAACTV